MLYAAWSQNGFRDAEQADRWRARAAGWLTDYVATLDPTDEPVGNERTVGATTERLALSGRVDRIDQRGDELVVVDYKTGRCRSTDDEARGSPALAAYVLGVRRTLRRPCSRVELHHLPSGTVAAFEHTERSLANHVRRAEDIAIDITAADRVDGRRGGSGRRLPGGPGPAVQLVRLPAQLPDRSGRGPAAGDLELPRRGRSARLRAARSRRLRPLAPRRRRARSRPTRSASGVPAGEAAASPAGTP